MTPSRDRTSIVHVIPAGVMSNTYQGSYKDTISRVRFLASNSCYRQVLLDQDDADEVLKVAEQEAAPAFLVEYSSFPTTIRAIRRRYASALIAVRSHNLEP